MEIHQAETCRAEMHRVETCRMETPDNKEELLEKEKTVVYYNAMRKSTEREYEYGFRAMLQGTGGRLCRGHAQTPEGRAGTPFLIKFLESDEVQRIDEALQERDYEKAFDLVHTLKGETMTLGLGRLSKSSIILCEQLRYKIYGEEMLQQFRKVKMDYQKTIDIIRKYRDSQP